jgi:hypothetical protein
VRVVTFVLLGFAGCAEISGLQGLGVCDGSCDDATVDAPQPVDTGTDVGDASNQGDAIPIDTGSDAPTFDATPTCKKPSECNNTQVCCETVVTKGNQYPSCTVDADTSACSDPGKCPTTSPSLSCGTYLLRRCAATADCTEQSAPRCCTFTMYGGTREVCLSSFAAQVADASCL